MSTLYPEEAVKATIQTYQTELEKGAAALDAVTKERDELKAKVASLTELAKKASQPSALFTASDLAPLASSLVRGGKLTQEKSAAFIQNILDTPSGVLKVAQMLADQQAVTTNPNHITPVEKQAGSVSESNIGPVSPALLDRVNTYASQNGITAQ